MTLNLPTLLLPPLAPMTCFYLRLAEKKPHTIPGTKIRCEDLITLGETSGSNYGALNEVFIFDTWN